MEPVAGGMGKHDRGDVIPWLYGDRRLPGLSTQRHTPNIKANPGGSPSVTGVWLRRYDERTDDVCGSVADEQCGRRRSTAG